jgi:hypothetical protein
MKRTVFLKFAVAVGAAALATSSAATYSFFLAPMYTPDFMMSNAAQRSLELGLERRRAESGGTRRSDASPNRSSTNANAALANSPGATFVPDPRVTAYVKKEFVQKMKLKYPGNDALIERTYADDLVSRFNSSIAGSGGNPRSVPDVVAGYLVSMHSIYHNRTASLAESRAAREQMRKILGPKVPSFGSDRAKQALSETLALRSISLTNTGAAIRRSGDPTALLQLRELTRKSAIDLGIDIERSVLTNTGFRPR